MNSLSVTKWELAIPFFRNQNGNDRWQVRSRYKHISRGWAKSSVLQNCFTNLGRMRCTNVIFATRFHEHGLTRIEIAGVRMVAMHPVRDHPQQCDWDPLTTCLKFGLTIGWCLSHTSFRNEKIRKKKCRACRKMVLYSHSHSTIPSWASIKVVASHAKWRSHLTMSSVAGTLIITIENTDIVYWRFHLTIGTVAVTLIITMENTDIVKWRFHLTMRTVAVTQIITIENTDIVKWGPLNKNILLEVYFS